MSVKHDVVAVFKFQIAGPVIVQGITFEIVQKFHGVYRWSTTLLVDDVVGE